MKYATSALLLAGCALLQACTPKPLDIQLTDKPRQMAVFSSVLDANTVFVTATYSINSLSNLNDTQGGGAPQALAADVLVQDGTVSISSGANNTPLSKITDGIYGASNLSLQPYQTYLLSVRDNKTGTTVTALTTYIPMVAVNDLTPTVTRRASDTTVKLHVSVPDDPGHADYFVMSYSRINPATIPSPIGSSSFGIINSDATKKLELFTDADAVGGVISRDFSVDMKATDTMYVHLGRIDKGYYEFLTAYKRTGNFLNQLTGEPISLPTNIGTGLGYFSLYEARREAFFLKDY